MTSGRTRQQREAILPPRVFAPKEKPDGSFDSSRVRRLSEAFDNLHTNWFDMLLLDLGSPEGDDQETLHQAHQKGEIPIVVLTGLRDAEVAMQALQQGQARTAEVIEDASAVRHPEARESALVEAALDAIITIDSEGKILEFNPAAERTFGYSRGEMIGQSLGDSIVPPAYREKHRLGLARFLATGVGSILDQRLELTALRAGGHEFPVELTITCISVGGSPTFTAHVRDITDRKQAEAALEDRIHQATLAADIGVILTRHERLRSTLQGCCEAIVTRLGVAFARIWTVNADQNLLELQASAGLYTHLDGAHSRVPVGQLKIGQIAEQRRPLMTNEVIGDPHVGDQEWAKREGMVAFAGYPLICQDRLVGVLAMFSRAKLTEAAMKAVAAASDGIATGIERSRAVEELRTSEERFDLAVRGSSDTIWDWNIQAGTVYFSPRFNEMLAYAKGELECQFATFVALIHPDDRAKVTHLIDKHLQEFAPFGTEFRLRAKDGEYRWFYSRGQALWNSEGIAYRMAGSISDITGRKQIEGLLAQRDEQLRQSQKLEAVGSLAGGIAHEFSNLLQAIRGFTHFAMEGLPTEDQRLNDLQQVIKATDRAVILTRQLLGFSRRQVLERTQFDPCHVVLDMVKMLRPLIGEHIDVEVSQATDVGTVCADQGQLQQMLLNLCINARDAMPSGGRLSLKTQRVDFSQEYCACHPTAKPGPYLLFSVSDNGFGMSPEVKERIFEPFFTTKDVGKGTGLGLATVYGVVQQHGGMINVYSEVGLGTTFKIYLPISVAAETSVEEQASGPVHGGTATILIAEDEPMVRDVTVRILAQAGYTLLIAADGAEAINLFEANIGVISLALLDAVMPKLNGHQVYEHIKLRKPGLPVVFCSGYDPGTGELNILMNEGLQLVQKPFDPQVLLRAVRHALDAANLTEAPQCIT